MHPHHLFKSLFSSLESTFDNNKLEVYSDLFCSIGSCDRTVSHCNDYCNYAKSFFIRKSDCFHHIHLLKIILIIFAIVGST